MKRTQLTSPHTVTAPARGSVFEVFRVFTVLGLTSFGGPAAHLGYFKVAFVDQRKWLDSDAYARLVALCQFLPGPASSQVGFALGLQRAGLLGALAAFVGFTLPSAVLLAAFAYGVHFLDGPLAVGALAGLKIVAVAVVAHAVMTMAGSLAAGARRAGIAAGAAVVALLVGGGLGQIAAMVGGAIAGLLLCRSTHGFSDSVSGSASGNSGLVRLTRPQRLLSALALVVFVALLVGLPAVSAAGGGAASGGWVSLFAVFFQAGALVFGGGHVVVPLLNSSVVEPGWVSQQDFLAGYGAAQSVPGPLFTFAGYLGAVANSGSDAVSGGGAVAGALIALVAVFLPGFLLVLAILPWWGQLSTVPVARALVTGTNAAVVGILGAALYNPIFTSAITSNLSLALALACFVMLGAWKLPPWSVVLVGASGGAVFTLLGWL